LQIGRTRDNRHNIIDIIEKWQGHNRDNQIVNG